MKDKRFEHRYLTFKLKDVKKYLTRDQQEQLEDLANAVADGRKLEGKDSVEGIFIEQDWPEYEPTAKSLLSRLAGDPKEKGVFEKFRALIGYVQNGSDVVVSVFQDDATNSYHLVAKSMGKTIWSEHNDCFTKLINDAYDKHAEKF